MRYRIEYADGRYCNFANGRAELLKWLKLLKQEEISDIRKVYKSFRPVRSIYHSTPIKILLTLKTMPLSEILLHTYPVKHVPNMNFRAYPNVYKHL